MVSPCRSQVQTKVHYRLNIRSGWSALGQLPSSSTVCRISALGGEPFAQGADLPFKNARAKVSTNKNRPFGRFSRGIRSLSLRLTLIGVPARSWNTFAGSCSTNYGRHFNAAIVGLIEGPRVAKQTWFGESLLWVTLLHEAMEDAQAGRKESHFSLRFPFLSFTRHRRLNNCCRTSTRWQIDVRVRVFSREIEFRIDHETDLVLYV